MSQIRLHVYVREPMPRMAAPCPWHSLGHHHPANTCSCSACASVAPLNHMRILQRTLIFVCCMLHLPLAAQHAGPAAKSAAACCVCRARVTTSLRQALMTLHRTKLDALLCHDCSCSCRQHSTLRSSPATALNLWGAAGARMPRVAPAARSPTGECLSIFIVHGAAMQRCMLQHLVRSQHLRAAC